MQKEYLINEELDVSRDILDKKEHTMSEGPKIKEFRPNWSYIAMIIALIVCQSVHTGYVNATAGRLYTFMSVRFEWTED